MSQKAARVGHPVGHSSNVLPTVLAIGGIIIGVVVTVGTLGAGAPVMAVIGYASTAGTAGINIGEYLSDGDFVDDGYTIKDGARTVFTELERMAKAHPDTTVDCHGKAYVCTGSMSVYVESRPASRRFDFTTCGGIVFDASNHVFIGGATIAENGRVAPTRPDEKRAGLFYDALKKALVASDLKKPQSLADAYKLAGALAELYGLEKPKDLEAFDRLLTALDLKKGPTR